MTSSIAFFHDQKSFPGYENITTATTARGFQEARGLAEGSKAARETVDVFTKSGNNVSEASKQITKQASQGVAERKAITEATAKRFSNPESANVIKNATQGKKTATTSAKGVIDKIANFAKNHKVLAGVAVAATLVGAVFAGTKIAEAKQAKQEKQDN